MCGCHWLSRSLSLSIFSRAHLYHTLIIFRLIRQYQIIAGSILSLFILSYWLHSSPSVSDVFITRVHVCIMCSTDTKVRLLTSFRSAFHAFIATHAHTTNARAYPCSELASVLVSSTIEQMSKHAIEMGLQLAVAVVVFVSSAV